MFEVQVGAVSTPELEIEPAVADHVTAVFVEPVTVAVNCCVLAEVTETAAGDTETATAPAAVTVTLAEADLVVSALLTAFTVTLVFAVTLGAVNSPAVEIDPAVADHVTPVFVEPLTVALNCCVLPEATVALAGETETATSPGGVTVTTAEADVLVSASLTAFTVTSVVELTVGAVKAPELEIDPALADHVTAEFVDPLTAAVNCCVPPEASVALTGEMAIVT